MNDYRVALWALQALTEQRVGVLVRGAVADEDAIAAASAEALRGGAR